MDLGAAHEYHYSDDSVEYHGSEDGGESGHEMRSSTDEEETGHPGTQPSADYTPLELAQRRRGRRRREQRGGRPSRDRGRSQLPAVGGEQCDGHGSQ